MWKKKKKKKPPKLFISCCEELDRLFAKKLAKVFFLGNWFHFVLAFVPN